MIVQVPKHGLAPSRFLLDSGFRRHVRNSNGNMKAEDRFKPRFCIIEFSDRTARSLSPSGPPIHPVLMSQTATFCVGVYRPVRISSGAKWLTIPSYPRNSLFGKGLRWTDGQSFLPTVPHRCPRHLPAGVRCSHGNSNRIATSGDVPPILGRPVLTKSIKKLI